MTLSVSVERTKWSHVRVLTWGILFLLAYQTLHEIDHLLQYMQKYIFGIDSPPGLFEGLLNSSDTIIHLYINGGEYLAFGIVWIALREGQLSGAIKSVPGAKVWPFGILVSSIFFLFTFQTLHVIDHFLQYVQLYIYNIQGPPGLFQGVLNAGDTVVHLYLNGIVYSTIILVWITFRECQLRRIIHPE